MSNILNVKCSTKSIKQEQKYFLFYRSLDFQEQITSYLPVWENYLQKQRNEMAHPS